MAKYSNGYGHLIVTVAVLASLTILLVFRAIDAVSAAAIMSPVIAFWFMSGAANRFQPRTDVSHDATATPAAPPPGGGVA